MRKSTLIGICLMGMVATAQAVSIFPNRVTVEGVVGERASIQFRIYGHPENASVEFVKAEDLRSEKDTVLTSFELGQEQQRIVPVDIVVNRTQEFYLCAVLKKSQSMRLRVCSAVRVIVSPR
jgi:hypothetical protein